YSLVELLEQRFLLSGILGAQVIEGKFGAELEASSAVMPNPLVMQQRCRHVVLMQGEGAGERGGVLEGLRGTLAEGGQHRVRRVPQQTDTTLHPGFQRITIVKAPLGRTNDRPRQSKQIFATATALECLAHLAEDFLATDGKPVAFL